MKAMKWLRLYVDVLDDPKVQRLPAPLFKCWVNLLCLTQRSGGVLPSLADVAFALRMSEEDARAALDELTARGLIDATADGTSRPHNWDGRQYASDNVAERVSRHRQKNVTTRHGDNAPPCNNYVTLQETAPETDTEYISTPLVDNYNPRDSDEDTGGGEEPNVEFAAVSPTQSETVDEPPAETAPTTAPSVQSRPRPKAMAPPRSPQAEGQKLAPAPPAPPPTSCPSGQKGSAPPDPWDDDPCDPRGPRLKAPSEVYRWDWVAVQAKLKGSPRADAAFIARTLAETDADPLRRHWRGELDQLICDAQPDSVTGFAAHRLRRWLAGEAPAPPQSRMRYADELDDPGLREFLKSYPGNGAASTRPVEVLQ